jgi:Flp pilus assembly pilin Flp
MRVIECVKRFAKDQSGATAIEYGLIAAGISVAIIGVLAERLELTASSAPGSARL